MFEHIVLHDEICDEVAVCIAMRYCHDVIAVPSAASEVESGSYSRETDGE